MSSVASACAGSPPPPHPVPALSVRLDFRLDRFLSAARRRVLELSSRYPQEGGLYIWAQKGFRRFRRLYLSMDLRDEQPALLFRRALLLGRQPLFAGGSHGWLMALTGDSGYFIGFTLVALSAITLLNVVGLNPAKWLNNAGALGMFRFLSCCSSFSASSHTSAPAAPRTSPGRPWSRTPA